MFNLFENTPTDQQETLERMMMDGREPLGVAIPTARRQSGTLVEIELKLRTRRTSDQSSVLRRSSPPSLSPRNDVGSTTNFEKHNHANVHSERLRRHCPQDWSFG